MTLELKYLAWSIVLGLIYMMAYALAIRSQNGVAWATGARDEDRPAQHLAGRLARAQRNFMETWPFFAVAVVLVHLLGRESAPTAWGCEIYLWARVVYLPLYAFGVPWVRSLVWVVSMVGLVMVLTRVF